MKNVSIILSFYLGEDDIHGVSSGSWISGGHADHLQTIGGELVTQEHVSEVDLTNNIDQSQQLTQEEVDRVATMGAQVLLEVSLDVHHLGHPLLLLVGHQWISEVIHQVPDQASLSMLPDESGEVEHDRLEEEEEDDPLIVAVMVEFFIMRSLDPGVRLVETNTVGNTHTIHITGHSTSGNNIVNYGSYR